MNKINVTSTAEAIEGTARTAKELSDRLYRLAEQMRTKDDISYASEAISEVTSAVGNFRIDLYVTRPIRELQRIAMDRNDDE